MPRRCLLLLLLCLLLQFLVAVFVQKVAAAAAAERRSCFASSSSSSSSSSSLLSCRFPNPRIVSKIGNFREREHASSLCLSNLDGAASTETTRWRRVRRRKSTNEKQDEKFVPQPTPSNDFTEDEKKKKKKKKVAPTLYHRKRNRGLESNGEVALEHHQQQQQEAETNESKQKLWPRFSALSSGTAEGINGAPNVKMDDEEQEEGEEEEEEERMEALAQQVEQKLVQNEPNLWMDNASPSWNDSYKGSPPQEGQSWWSILCFWRPIVGLFRSKSVKDAPPKGDYPKDKDKDDLKPTSEMETHGWWNWWWDVYVDQSKSSLERGSVATLDAFIGLCPSSLQGAPLSNSSTSVIANGTVFIHPALLRTTVGTPGVNGMSHANSRTNRPSGTASFSSPNSANAPSGLSNNNNDGPVVQCILRQRQPRRLSKAEYLARLSGGSSFPVGRLFGVERSKKPPVGDAEEDQQQREQEVGEGFVEYETVDVIQRAFQVTNVDSVDKVYRVLTKHMAISNIDPSSRECLKFNYRGNAHLERGEIPEAIQAYGKALDAAQEDDEQRGVVLLMRATAYLKRALEHQRQLRTAVKELAVSIQLDENANTDNTSKNNNRNAASNTFTTNDESRDSYYCRQAKYRHGLLGLALLHAARDALESTRLLPHYARTWLRAADSLAELHKFPEAIRYYQRAMELDATLETSLRPILDKLQKQEQQEAGGGGGGGAPPQWGLLTEP